MRLVNLSAGRRPGAWCAPTPAASACPRAHAAATTTAPRRAGRTTRSPARARSWSSCPPAPLTRRLGAPPRAAPCCVGRARATAARVAAPPRIVWTPHPVRRHPPRADARLRQAPLRHRPPTACRPKVIVEHFTASSTLLLGLEHVRLQRARRRAARAARACARTSSSTRTARSTSSSRSGCICRHTVGLNDRAIGIEHVGILRRRDPRPPDAAARVAARSRAGCSRATASGRATSSATPRASRARTTTSASRACAPRRTATGPTPTCAATGRSCEPRSSSSATARPSGAAPAGTPAPPTCRCCPEGEAQAREVAPRLAGREFALVLSLAAAARPPHRRAGRLRRPRRARRRPQGARLRRVRGADHEGDPASSARAGTCGATTSPAARRSSSSPPAPTA